MYVQYTSLLEHDMSPSDIRCVYRPSGVRAPRWVSMVWGWV